MLFTKALAVLSAESNWATCDPHDECDQCATARLARCRFTSGARRLLWPSLYNSTGNLTTAGATAYLIGPAKRPLTAKSGWAKVHKVAPDLANAVAATVAGALRKTGRSDIALPAAEKLWKSGVRDPQLAVVFAALTEDKEVCGAKLAAFRSAAAICQDALASAAGGAAGDWQPVKTRLARPHGRINAATRKPPKAPYKTRPPHRTRFVKP